MSALLFFYENETRTQSDENFYSFPCLIVQSTNRLLILSTAKIDVLSHQPPQLPIDLLILSFDFHYTAKILVVPEFDFLS